MLQPKYRILAAVLLVLAATIHLLNTGYRDWTAGGDAAYVLGLLFLFFWREKFEDERVKDLKFKALTVGFLAGYVATFAGKLAASAGWNAGRTRTISAVDFMFVALVVAFALFHWWRWQDGRPGRLAS